MFSDVSDTISDIRVQKRTNKESAVFIWCSVFLYSIGCTFPRMKIFTYLNVMYSVWSLEADLVEKNPSLSPLVAQKTLQEMFLFVFVFFFPNRIQESRQYDLQ